MRKIIAHFFPEMLRDCGNTLLPEIAALRQKLRVTELPVSSGCIAVCKKIKLRTPALIINDFAQKNCALFSRNASGLRQHFFSENCRNASGYCVHLDVALQRLNGLCNYLFLRTLTLIINDIAAKNCTLFAHPTSDCDVCLFLILVVARQIKRVSGFY